MSTTVSNPYSFNIKNNTGFTSPTIVSVLPDSDTLLETIIEEIKTITIPLGCKVVRLDGYTPASGDGPAEVIVYDITNAKLWCHIEGDFYGASDTVYVGVTPGKTYKLHVHGRGEEVTCEIYYSKDINNKTPDVTDY